MMSKCIFSKDEYLFYFIFYSMLLLMMKSNVTKSVTYLPLQLACNHVIFPEIAFIDGCKSK